MDELWRSQTQYGWLSSVTHTDYICFLIRSLSLGSQEFVCGSG